MHPGISDVFLSITALSGVKTGLGKTVGVEERNWTVEITLIKCSFVDSTSDNISFLIVGQVEIDLVGTSFARQAAMRRQQITVTCGFN